MPHSKKEKEVSLTKIKKKSKEDKTNLLNEIRKSVEAYSHVFVFSLENLRTTFISKIRQYFKNNSRIFYGKNNLMSVALGKSEEDEISKDLHKISKLLKGQCGLMFTNETEKNIRRYFEAFIETDFARAGATADETIEIPEGPLPGIVGPLEPRLRKLGLPTRLENGVIELLEDYTICKEGDVLTSDQSKLLKIFDFKLTRFKVEIEAHWSKKKGFTAY